MRTRLWLMLDLLLATLLLALSTLPDRTEEWRQCLLVEVPETHMLLHGALPERTATVVDTAGMAGSEVQGAVMAAEVADLWVLLLRLAIGDAVRGLVLMAAEEVATEVVGAATSGIGHLHSSMVPLGHLIDVYRPLPSPKGPYARPTTSNMLKRLAPLTTSNR